MDIFFGIMISILFVFELILVINFIIEGKRIEKIISIRMQLENMKNPRTGEDIPLVIKKEDLKFQDLSQPYDYSKIKVRSFAK